MAMSLIALKLIRVETSKSTSTLCCLQVLDMFSYEAKILLEPVGVKAY